VEVKSAQGFILTELYCRCMMVILLAQLF